MELNSGNMKQLMTAALVLLLCRAALAQLPLTPATNDDIASLIEQLADPDVRQGASQMLVSIGEPATKPLAEALSSDSVDVRIWAANTLGKIGPPAASAVGPLAKQLADESRDLRAVTARALGRIGATDETVIERLSGQLSDPDVRVRRWTAVALGEIGPAARTAVPSLVSALNDEPIRRSAIEALVGIGDPSLPALIEALADDTVRIDASDALQQIAPDRARAAGVDHPSVADLTALSLALQNPERETSSRVAAARTLGQIGPDAAAALIAVFADDEVAVSRAAAAAFGSIGIDALPELRKSMQHESPRVRATAADAVAAIGTDASDAIVDLIELLHGDDRTVRFRAVFALRAVGSEGEAAISALIETMQNPREVEATRQLAVKTLGRTGPAVRETVIARLEESTSDDNYGVRSLAAQVLKRLKAETSAE